MPSPPRLMFFKVNWAFFTKASGTVPVRLLLLKSRVVMLPRLSHELGIEPAGVIA